MHVYCVCRSVCVYICHVPMWRWEDNFLELDLSVYRWCWGLISGHQVGTTHNTHFYLLSNLLPPACLLLRLCNPSAAAYAAIASLELTAALSSQPPVGWPYRHKPPCLVLNQLSSRIFLLVAAEITLADVPNLKCLGSCISFFSQILLELLVGITASRC